MSRKPPTSPHEGSPGSAWVVSHAYEGPNRRRRGSLFARKRVRLDDAGAAPVSGGESTDTTLRRLGLWAGLSGAARDQRAKFVAVLEGAAQRGKSDGARVWPMILDAVARYLRAVGAQGRIDEPLVDEALHAAQLAHAEGELAREERELIARLEARARAPH